MSVKSRSLDWFGRFIARQLSKPTSGYVPYAAARPELVAMIIRPADVLLIEGRRSNISSAIRYLTRSTWSHAALYVGLGANLGERDDEAVVLVEAELGKGVISSPLSKYATHNTRICRPIGLSPEDRMKVIRFAVERIGLAYDLKNIIDLLRYLLPQPPVPVSWRRRMIALGSGEPTRAICSSLIAEAFQSVRYPILPEVRLVDEPSRREILHIRHHSLYTPRDFDISPFFAIVKPTIETGFDYRRMAWATDQDAQSDETRAAGLNAEI
jgi:Permuted papain-like amidase enzyme, YaeF/YiiX, C92 family